MNIFKASHNGHIQSLHVLLAVDMVDDGIEFSTVYEIAEEEQYSGPRWTHDGKEYGLVSKYRFDCSDLKDSAQWSDVASWHLNITEKRTLYVENLHAETTATKATSGAYAVSTGLMPIAVMYVPWASSNISGVSVLLNVDEDSTIIAGDGINIVPYAGSPADWRGSLMPAITLAGGDTITPDSDATYTATVTRNGIVASDCNSEVCIETTGGYLPLQRVRAVNGVATFRVKALDLQAGDAFKIKVGFRNYSSLASKQITVI